MIHPPKLLLGNFIIVNVNKNFINNYDYKYLHRKVLVGSSTHKTSMPDWYTWMLIYSVVKMLSITTN